MGQRMIVRKMQPSEINSVVTLTRYFAEDAGLKDEDYDENEVVQTLKQYSSHWEYCLFVAYEGQRPVGMIGGCVTKLPWNKQLNAHIDYVYILESHRNLQTFKQLMTEFEAWARLLKVKEITAGDIGIDPERNQRLYAHLEFKPGMWMEKELTYV
jgi:GNAT superfamily N-acetyltransferase